MKNINRKPHILMFVFYLLTAHIVYAESADDSESHIATYRCGSLNEPLQRVNVNLGGGRGFVQLDVPLVNFQPVSIYALKQCLLDNGLMSKAEFVDYSRALATCRQAYHQGKVQYERGKTLNLSTKPAFDFEHCLRENLLN